MGIKIANILMAAFILMLQPMLIFSEEQSIIDRSFKEATSSDGWVPTILPSNLVDESWGTFVYNNNQSTEN